LLAVITSSFHLYSLLLIVVVLVNDHDDVILTGTLKGEVAVIAHPQIPTGSASPVSRTTF
jgi:hypothetical protein